MKNLTLTLTFISLLMGGSNAVAGSLTVPHTPVPNTPAKAEDFNKHQEGQVYTIDKIMSGEW